MAGDPFDQSEPESGPGDVVYLSGHSGPGQQWWSGTLRLLAAGVVLVAGGIIAGFLACWVWRQIDDLPIGTEIAVGIVVGVAGWVGLLIVRWIVTGRWLVVGSPPRRDQPSQRSGKDSVTRIGAVAVVVIVGTPTFVWMCEDGGPDDCDRTPSADAVEVMVVWVNSELAAFCDVVAAYGEGDDVDVEVTSVGTEIGAQLDARFGNEDPPDVAIIPQASLVRRYGDEGCLVRLDDENDSNMISRFPAAWNRFVTTSPPTGEARQWGVFVKGADKSMFWYSIDALEGASPPPQDWSWDDLTRWAQDSTNDPAAPLTLAAADMWPLTDWFENQLAGVDPELYDRLSRATQLDWSEPAVQDSVRSALEQMVELWTVDDIFAEDIMSTGLADLDDRLRDGEAAVVFSPSFLAGQENLYRDGSVDVFGFPSVSGRRPRVVGGDIAVVPTQPSGRVDGDDFVEWLTDEPAMRRWSAADPGFLTPNLQSPHAQGETRGDDVRVWLTSQLLRPQPELFFDLSDDRLAALNEHDPRGSWDIFYDFFRNITGNARDEDAAIAEVAQRLESEWEGSDGPEPSCDW
jgi:ABC-type glycerol-3-phosphate transport system substrate-binding protein